MKKDTNYEPDEHDKNENYEVARNTETDENHENMIRLNNDEKC